jgi:hypothetical protein
MQMYLKKFLFIFLVFCCQSTSPVIICDQLMTLAPSAIRFTIHPIGELLAAQEPAAGSNTQLAFYRYEQSTPEGRSASLARLCSIPEESAQGSNWAWAQTTPFFAISNPSGTFSIYKLQTDDESATTKAVLVAQEQQSEQACLIAWNKEGDVIAIATNTQIKLYVLDEESELPLRCVFSKKHSLAQVKFLGWSANDLFLSLGNSQTLLLWTTRTTSGALRLSPYTNKKIDQTLSQGSVGEIRDISWGRGSSQSIAILGKKIIIINIPEGSLDYPRVIQNIAPSNIFVIAWNQTPQTQDEKQEVIAASQNGTQYRVYTVTENSLAYDSTMHSLLPVSNTDEHSPLQRFNTIKPVTHEVASTTEVEIVNKLVSIQNSLS